MCDSESILRVYNNVLTDDIITYQLTEDAIISGIKMMTDVYKPSLKLTSITNDLADYENAAHRTAYLHKYAAFHTVMVRELALRAILTKFQDFYNLVFSRDGFRICSLGGGPGSDVVGLLSALHTAFSYFNSSACVVDYMYNWCYSFNSIIKELRSGFYGSFGFSLNSHLFSWNYLGADLLKPFSFDVANSLSSASIVTMIKFASAAACVDTEIMVKAIFKTMKPGAMLLFIDNAAGGFHEIILRAANKFNFLTVYGPLKHEVYTNRNMRVFRFGYSSCYSSTVTCHILQKPFVYDLQMHLTPYIEYCDNFPPPRRVVYRDFTDFEFVEPPIESPPRTLEKSKRRRTSLPKIKKWHNSLTAKVKKVTKKAKTFLKKRIERVKKI